jgi:hypothetical protein
MCPCALDLLHLKCKHGGRQGHAAGPAPRQARHRWTQAAPLPPSVPVPMPPPSGSSNAQKAHFWHARTRGPAQRRDRHHHTLATATLLLLLNCGTGGSMQGARHPTLPVSVLTEPGARASLGSNGCASGTLQPRQAHHSCAVPLTTPPRNLQNPTPRRISAPPHVWQR